MMTLVGTGQLTLGDRAIDIAIWSTDHGYIAAALGSKQQTSPAPSISIACARLLLLLDDSIAEVIGDDNQVLASARPVGRRQGIVGLNELKFRAGNGAPPIQVSDMEGQ